jgi:hypothetical protein
VSDHPPVLFLDMDGVLNAPGDYAPGCALVRPVLAARLQRVLDATGAEVVLSSAWRYQVLLGACTLKGFEHLLRTHGIRCRLVGVTDKDNDAQVEATGGATNGDQRSGQIRRWLAAFRPDVTRWAAVDDSMLDLGAAHYVGTDGARGLQDEQADRLIALLRGRA